MCKWRNCSPKNEFGVLDFLNKKKIKTIKEAFMSRVACENWLQTVEQHGHFADENILRDLFLELKCSPIPAAFNEYCAKALK